MNKIISVVGPTASGKTSFALKLANKYLQNSSQIYEGVDLISVDSRQVYSGIEVLTGADIPEGFQKTSSSEFMYPYFKNLKENINIHGVSIIELLDDWSVAHFKNFAIDIIENSWKNNRLPILVGGTGLYHKYLFSKDENIYIPPNKELREKAQNMNIEELQKWLAKIDKQALLMMNNSDKNNSRRLIRAIEKKLGKPLFSEVKNIESEYDSIVYAMKLSLEELRSNIMQRVLLRFDQGVVLEIEKINKVCSKVDSSVCSSLGVADLNRYLLKEITKEECMSDWGLHEYQYSKRQLTWFSKQPGVIWLDALKKNQYT